MNTKKKVYAFYITIIALAVLAMMVFDLNLMAKSILCLIVFFSDSKRLLGLADCSSRDFSAHIAHVSLVMIRYNILASIKEHSTMTP